MSTEEQLRAELEAAKSWISGDSVRIGELRRELERVTADRDAKAEECHEVSAHAAKAMEDRDALRARIADLEAAASLHWITEVELRQSRARVAELEAALLEEKRIHPEDFQQGDFRERAIAAARAESATPKEVQP